MVKLRTFAAFGTISLCVACTGGPQGAVDATQPGWQMVDDFESGLGHWTHIDADNQTDPFVPDPQIAQIEVNQQTGNHYLLRKPAADGVVGNRKAIGFIELPLPVEVGETVTIFTRFNVEYFPNNQSFGLANVPGPQIPTRHYDAFEPMIRITDKRESDGTKNDGALMILSGDGKRYSKIIDPASGDFASPLMTDEWYELWYVVYNAPRNEGGQRYDLYLRGGEFQSQQLVFEGADFRMRRASPLLYFMTICNTGPHHSPYGNGGVRYDDIYMIPGINLSSPLR